MANKEGKKLHEQLDKVPEEESLAIVQTGLADLQDAIALQKWLGVHIIPRVVAIAASTSRTFCARHMGSKEALDDIHESTSLDAFVALCKEHFFKQMNENMLMVLPNVETTESLLKHPYRVAKAFGQELRSSRQPRAPPPWFGTRTRKTAQLLLSNVGWIIADSCWQHVRFALRAQVLTWNPGAAFYEKELLHRLPFEFGVEESELHKLVPKIQLPEIVLMMSKVLSDEALSSGGGMI